MQRTDGSGELIAIEQYDAWGNPTGMVDKNGIMSSIPPPSGGGDPFGYNGQSGYYTDRETGLILCTHRYYDPVLGRWLTEDPIGEAGWMNLYGYCEGQPVDGSDCRGLIDNKVTIDEMILRHGDDVGHHLISWSLISNQVEGIKFNNKFASFCNNIVSGPIGDHNGYHGDYTKAIIEEIEDMKGTYGEDLSKWGIKEAKELIRRVLTSTDSRILKILQKIPQKIPWKNIKNYAKIAGVEIEKFGVEAVEVAPEVTEVAGSSIGWGTIAGAGIKFLGCSLFFYAGILADTATPTGADEIPAPVCMGTKYYYEKSTKILWEVDTFDDISTGSPRLQRKYTPFYNKQ